MEGFHLRCESTDQLLPMPMASVSLWETVLIYQGIARNRWESRSDFPLALLKSSIYIYPCLSSPMFNNSLMPCLHMPRRYPVNLNIAQPFNNPLESVPAATWQ